ncbi:MAG: glycosyltransferase family 4 protein [Actinomycetia bacterium]|nr:glycosyltransferase family 4 protein [Actinomycetes bacterium]MCP4958379.1 glycosyltransferase family 4 protein [Actinomycetes bacterium]
MRIGIVCPYSLTVWGGVQNQVLGLGRALSSKGHRVRVLGPCDGPPPHPGVTPLGESIPTDANGSVAPVAPDMACILRTIRVLRDEQFDVVHLHEPIVPGPCQAVLILNDVPVVATWHAAGGSMAYHVPGVKILASRVSRRAVVSADALEMASEALGGEYETLWNGIEVKRFAEGEVFPTEAPTILFVGRHESRKGLSVLIEAMQYLPRDVRLWVIGSGPETKRLKRLSQDDSRIEWLGAIDEVEKLARVRGADVFCVPSLRGESFGVVLLEGMAAGTAVVASDLPGYRNVVATGDEAVLVAPGDPAALASALQRVLSDGRLAADLVEKGRLRADLFSMARLADRYVSLYREAIFDNVAE